MFDYYFWATFALSLVCLLTVKSRLSIVNNIGGSVLLSFFGFVLWPFFVAAAAKFTKQQGGAE